MNTRGDTGQGHGSTPGSRGTGAPRGIGWPVLAAVLVLVVALVVGAGWAVVRSMDNPPRQYGQASRGQAHDAKGDDAATSRSPDGSTAPPRAGKTVTLKATSKRPATVRYGDTRSSHFETFDGEWTKTVQLHDRVDVAHLKVVSRDADTEDTVTCEIEHKNHRAAYEKVTGAPASSTCRALSKGMH